jgi:hypothetical protein
MHLKVMRGRYRLMRLGNGFEDVAEDKTCAIALCHLHRLATPFKQGGAPQTAS